MRETKSTCCYCGVGCGVIIQSEGDRIVGVKGDPDHPANFGRLCTKGTTLHLSATGEGRALFPELRRERGLPLQRAGWEDALDLAAERFSQIIQEHGPDAVAFYVSGQLLTEDYYVFNKLAKGLIGTNNIDTNSRLCMSSAVAGYKATLGVDAPPACYEDIDHSRCLFIAGSNTAFAHPVLFRRIEQARAKNPELKIVVVDPRRTDTAQVADLHLAIQPGTDVALFNGMLHLLLWEGLVDMDYIRQHTEGFDALKQIVREYTPKLVCDICGIAENDLIRAAQWFGHGPTLSLYCQGLNQSTSGTDKNAALINLHLATGQIGKPGAGPLSLTGQPNAMGGREVGAMANLLSAHRDLTNPEHRAEVAALWGIARVPDTPGKAAVEMFDALKTGEIKAIWIACTNPAQSMPDLAQVHEALEKAEFVVVQDAFRHTDTTRFADVLLPATTWGEKEGTVTNSERRITHLHPAISAPGEARHDWEIVVDFAGRLAGRLPHAASADALFPYSAPQHIFDEHCASTRGRDLDITGLSYALLDQHGPQQWPFPAGAETGKARLYEDGLFCAPEGRARFANVQYRPVAEKTDARYPFHLNTGRLRDQWHGMSRTGLVPQLFNHVEEPLIAMHPADMERRGIGDGDLVRVTSRRGSLVLRAQSSEEMLPAHTFIPMHWGGQFMQGAGCNALTVANCDPVSKQPEFKHAAIRVEKVTLPWQLVAIRRNDHAGLLDNIRGLLSTFEYASCGRYGRSPGIVVLRAAHHQAPDDGMLETLDQLLNMDDDDQSMSYNDPRRGISKRIVLDGGEPIGLRLSGETLAAGWLKEVMVKGEMTDELRRWALAPLKVPPEGSHDRGRIVCSCLDVAESEIRAELANSRDLSVLQAKLKCGTECGSCVPELKRLIDV